MGSGAEGHLEREDPSRSPSSVFHGDEAGRILHTWSASGRGAEAFRGVYRYVDVTPRDRFQEGGIVPLDWVRLRNEYGKGGYVDRKPRYRGAPCECSLEQAADLRTCDTPKRPG
jgi:hypothetical protein